MRFAAFCSHGSDRHASIKVMSRRSCAFAFQPSSADSRRVVRLSRSQYRALGNALREAEHSGENRMAILAIRLLALTGCRRGAPPKIARVSESRRDDNVHYEEAVEDTKRNHHCRPDARRPKLAHKKGDACYDGHSGRGNGSRQGCDELAKCKGCRRLVSRGPQEQASRNPCARGLVAAYSGFGLRHQSSIDRWLPCQGKLSPPSQP